MATKKHDESKAVAFTTGDAAGLIFAALLENGELNDAELIQWVQAEDGTADDRTVERAIVRLDRNGTITQSSKGWQLTGKGQDAAKQIENKRAAPFIAPYSNQASVVAEYELETPCLGPVTEPGSKGTEAFLLRLADDRIIIPGACIRAAMEKAVARIDQVVYRDLNNNPKVLPRSAWEHVQVASIRLPANTRIMKAERRPTNVQGQAVGVIIHEALPPGTKLTVRAELPLSHFPEPMIRRLFQALAEVGISPAGSGKGGRWGVAELQSLTLDGRDLLATVEDEGMGRSNGHRPLLPV